MEPVLDGVKRREDVIEYCVGFRHWRCGWLCQHDLASSSSQCVLMDDSLGTAHIRHIT